jgi:hypothetical protein
VDGIPFLDSENRSYIPRCFSLMANSMRNLLGNINGNMGRQTSTSGWKRVEKVEIQEMKGGGIHE